MRSFGREAGMTARFGAQCTSRSMVIRAAVLAAVVAIVQGLPGMPACGAAVTAHATLERSAPGAGAALDAAPRQVDLFFGQQLVQNRSGTFAIVYSDSGMTVSDETRLDPQDGKHLQVPLRGGL